MINVISWIILGFLAGAIAKAIYPGRQGYPLVTSFLTFQTFVAHGFQDSVNNL